MFRTWITAPNTKKHTGNTTELLGKQFFAKLKGSQAHNQRGATRQLPPLKRLCIEDVLPMFVFAKGLSQLESD